MQGGSGAMRAATVLAALLLCFGGYKLYARGRDLQGDLVITGRTPPGNQPLPKPPTEPDQPPVGSVKPDPEPPATPAKPADVVIHVAGAVKKPGLYHLPMDSRVDDALRAAGGAKTDANLDAINLAAHVEDGKQLYLPTRKEQPEGGAAEQTGVATTANTPATHATGRTSNKLTSPSQGTVNINKAGEDELQRLPGVGPSYAARIVEFRKLNGAFTNIEQLMDVSGIGEKKFEAMRPFVRVK